MDEEKAGEATTDGRAIYETFAGPTVPARGKEIDVRPDPAGVHAGDKTQSLKPPEAPEVREVTADWPEGHTTGAFVSRAASFRYEVAEYRWGQVLWSVLLLYVVAVGLPVVGGIWAGVVIWNRMHRG